ncbi:MAG: M48 family metallopeptidase [Nitrososphaeria archaeon]
MKVFNRCTSKGLSPLYENLVKVDETQYRATIDTEVPPGYMKYLPPFLGKYHVFRFKHSDLIADVRHRTVDERNCVEYRVSVPGTTQYVDILVEPDIPVKVTMSLSDPQISPGFLDALYQDLFLAVQAYEEKLRRSTVYLAFQPGEKISEEKTKGGGIIHRMLGDSMLGLFMVFMLISFAFFYIFFAIFQLWTPIILVAMQFVFVLLAGRIAGRQGDWKITESTPEIELLQYTLPVEEYKQFRDKHAKEIPKLRKEIYESSVGVGKPIDCSSAHRAFQSVGIDCVPENFSTKRINLYELLKKVTEKFRLPMPHSVVVANTTVPNAAATGPGPSQGTVIVTTGIMTQLEEDELAGVLGHEISHLKARDPFVLFSLTSAEFIARFYIAFTTPFFTYVPFILYFLIVYFLIYFFGKFLEARADLDSAKFLGKPKLLAEALSKIGFRRMIYTRGPEASAYRIQEWISFDPHPPMYFRVQRLQELREPVEVKHTFWQSVSDCLRGFATAL